MVEQVLGILKDERVSVAMMVLVVCLAMLTHAWANDRFAKQTEFDELRELLISHTEEFRINNASQIIRDLKTDLRIARATNAPEVELNRLMEQLDHAERYKDCLVHRRPNCEFLRERE